MASGHVVEEDWVMSDQNAINQIRVMRIIARMNIGGPAVQVSGLMKGMNNLEFDQRLYTGFCATDEADYLETVEMGVKALRIEGLGRRLSFSGDIRAFLNLVREIQKFKPHIIHTHTAKAGFLGRIASILSLHSSIRVHTFHGHLLNGYFGVFKKTLLILTERSLAYFTNQLLAVGDRVRQDLLEAGVGSIDKFALMPPGLAISALPSKAQSQKSFGVDQEKLHCSFIGRVTQIKRPDRFLDVVKEIKKRNINLNFFIAGDGELLEKCRARINVENLPVVPLGWRGDIENVLSVSDIIILTSDNEGTPLSLIQAGMAGLPVVSTNVGSVPEVILDGLTGILTGFDVEEIADALEKLVNEKALRNSMGDAAKEFTLANFGVQRLVNDHEELYRNLIASRANS